MEEFALVIAQANEKEHHEAKNFINEFKASHELLLKEQNNMINGLAIEVHQLLTTLNKVLLVRHDLKGITTRGGKLTFQIGETPEDNNTNNISPGTLPSEQEQPNETNPEPEIRKEPSVEPKRSTLPFPHRVWKEKEDAYQRKGGFLDDLDGSGIGIGLSDAKAVSRAYARALGSFLASSKVSSSCAALDVASPLLLVGDWYLGCQTPPSSPSSHNAKQTLPPAPLPAKHPNPHGFFLPILYHLKYPSLHPPRQPVTGDSAIEAAAKNSAAPESAAPSIVDQSVVSENVQGSVAENSAAQETAAQETVADPAASAKVDSADAQGSAAGSNDKAAAEAMLVEESPPQCASIKRKKKLMDIPPDTLDKQVNVTLLEEVIKHFTDLSTKKAELARIQAQALEDALDVDDLEADKQPEDLMLSYVSDEKGKHHLDRELVTPWFKFLWETYMTVLEILRNNSKFIALYAGTTDAMRRCLWVLKQHPVAEFLVLLGPHFYKMDYQKLIEAHRNKKADVTVALQMINEGNVVCGTGAIGFIASWIAKLLQARGYTVHATVKSLGELAGGTSVPVFGSVDTGSCHFQKLSHEHEASVHLEQGHRQSPSSTTINSDGFRNIHRRRAAASGSDRLPGSVLLARERLAERLRGVSVSGYRQTSRSPSNTHQDDFHSRVNNSFVGTNSNLLETRSERLIDTTRKNPPGLTRDALNSLQLQVFSNENDEKTSSECTICLEAFQDGDKLIRLRCGHEFHSCCIFPWVRHLKRNAILNKRVETNHTTLNNELLLTTTRVSRFISCRNIWAESNSYSGRTSVIITGESRKKEDYLCFPEHYCACYSFFYDIVNRGEQLCCKHQLAARLAVSLGTCVDVKVSDEQLAELLAKL
ncbi:zinc finger, RING/FYVE/PHD-type [Artemisia annua]|uniref:Zinc finger, RING/FYVE/PHD-type n=1 Tax=Artemisia annua TaxID=35608 RepID=A0A2U1MUY4_ARTAN|nr:zinc finger, RING/FYVE/PHD-type [Artemisia annua]